MVDFIPCTFQVMRNVFRIAVPHTLSCKNRLFFYNIDNAVVSGPFVHIFKQCAVNLLYAAV